MKLLRRLATPFAALLALIVAGEVTDLVPCVDAECGAWSVLLGDGVPANGDGPAGAPEAACICHARFVPAAATQGVLVAGVATPGLVPAVATRLSAGVADVPHPPPLG